MIFLNLTGWLPCLGHDYLKFVDLTEWLRCLGNDYLKFDGMSPVTGWLPCHGSDDLKFDRMAFSRRLWFRTVRTDRSNRSFERSVRSVHSFDPSIDRSKSEATRESIMKLKMIGMRLWLVLDAEIRNQIKVFHNAMHRTCHKNAILQKVDLNIDLCIENHFTFMIQIWPKMQLLLQPFDLTSPLHIENRSESWN